MQHKLQMLYNKIYDLFDTFYAAVYIHNLNTNYDFIG